MSQLPEEIEFYMDDHMGIYVNPHDVEIIMSLDASMLAAVAWPGVQVTEERTVEVIVECETMEEFIEIFDLRRVLDMGRITPQLLLELYRQGKGEIYVAIENSDDCYPMYFRRQNNRLIAKGDYDVEHVVSVWLETPEQFMHYTEKHFHLDE